MEGEHKQLFKHNLPPPSQDLNMEYNLNLRDSFIPGGNRHLHGLQEPEFRPYLPAGLENHPDFALHGMGNPSPNPYDDLERDFRRLSVSGETLNPNFGAGHGGGVAFDRMNNFNFGYSTAELNRMRVELAARTYFGGMGDISGDFQNLYNTSNIPGVGEIGYGYGYGSRLPSPYAMFEDQSPNLYRNCSNVLQYSGASHEALYPNALSMFMSKHSDFNSRRGSGFARRNMDRKVSSFLQSVISTLERRPDQIHVMFPEVKEHALAMMIDPIGKEMMQKLYSLCNEDEINQLVLLVIDDQRVLKDICIDVNGTRVVQDLIVYMKTPAQRSAFVSVLQQITLPLAKNMNGHHVLKKCLETFSLEENKPLLNVVADNCLDIAMDNSGCCAMQNCLTYAEGEPHKRLIAELTSNALILSQDRYGNYVIQYLVEKAWHARAAIISQLIGNYVALCKDKCGSYVVERCLKESEGYQLNKIINEIIRSPNFLSVLQDPYGNYVVQCALNAAKGPIRQAIIDKIQLNMPELHSHPHGKRVLACTRGARRG